MRVPRNSVQHLNMQYWYRYSRDRLPEFGHFRHFKVTGNIPAMTSHASINIHKTKVEKNLKVNVLTRIFIGSDLTFLRFAKIHPTLAHTYMYHYWNWQRCMNKLCNIQDHPWWCLLADHHAITNSKIDKINYKQFTKRCLCRHTTPTSANRQ